MNKHIAAFLVIGAMGAPMATGTAYADPEPDLVTYLTFEDGADPTGDFSGHGNLGDLRPDGSGPWFAGPPAPWPGSAQALEFDGVDDEVAIANAPDLNFVDGEPMTIALWVLAHPYDPSSAWFNVAGKRVGCDEIQYQFAQDPFNRLHFNGGGGIVSSGMDLQIGQWMHVAATYDGGGTLRMYVNGGEAAMANGYSLGPPNAADLMVGVSGTCSHFRGRIDEFRLYRRALSPPEIAGLGNGGGPCCFDPPDDGTIRSPHEFADRTGDLGTPTVIDFDELDASPMNASLNGRDEFDGATYTDLGVTFSNATEALYIAPGGLGFCGPQGGCDTWNESNSLSVGEFPFPDEVTDDNDDDLTVTINPASPAVGFTIVDNGGSGPDEWVRFLDIDGDVVHETGIGGGFAPFRSFFGIVSHDRPIARIEITEAPNDGDDIDYDDFIILPPPVPDFTPRNLTVSNAQVVTDYGTTPVFTSWSRTIDVDVANVGGLVGDVTLEVWVRTISDGKRTLVGSASARLRSGETVHERFDWNGFGMVGNVAVEARTCSTEDDHPANDTAAASHYVVAGGTGFGFSGPVTFGSGNPCTR